MNALFNWGAAPEERGLRLFAAFALAGAGMSLILLAVRIAGAMSLMEPLQLHTTGDEFTNHYAIWRHVQGLPVYTDRFSQPFYYAIYNWLFYEFYGDVTGAVLQLFLLSDPWLPTVGRFISLASMVVGVIAAYLVFVRAAETADWIVTLICLAFAVFVMAGPLIGYWNITVRADLWARTLETIGIAIFLAAYPRKPWTGLTWFIVLAYLAWAFKQSNVFAPGAVGLFLLARRDWKPAAVLAVGLPSLWAATIYFGEPQYVHNFLPSDLPLTFTGQRLLRNVVNFTVKSGPILLFLAGLVWVAFAVRRRFSDFWRSDAFVIGFSGALCTSALSFPASAQTGGAENYFFTLSFFMALIAAASLPILRRADGPVLGRVLMAGNAGWMTLITAIGLVLAGVTGVTDTRPQHIIYMAGARCLETLPRPLFVNNAMLSLPWITPNDVHWVRSFNYYDDRRSGNTFKEGGIGGLIASGRFKAIATQKTEGTPAPKEIDGGSLAGYRLAGKDETARRACKGFFLFFRDDAPLGKAG